MSGNRKLRLATIWLDGCSGCHMSFLDMDERLIELASLVEVVYSPFVDAKQMPDEIDLALVEGAVATTDDLDKLRDLRARSKYLISFGDCAVNGNVPSMRNLFDAGTVYDRAFIDTSAINKGRPDTSVPVLLNRVQPVHEIVEVDLFLQGCPPPADAIYAMLVDLVGGKHPDTTKLSRFGL